MLVENCLIEDQIKAIKMGIQRIVWQFLIQVKLFCYAEEGSPLVKVTSSLKFFLTVSSPKKVNMQTEVKAKQLHFRKKINLNFDSG